MSLSVDSRYCGNVYVVRCSGRMVVGEESTILENAINRGLREFVRIVVQLDEVTRADSTGMGMLVRFLTHTRNRGGDLRLAGVPPFLDQLLQMTRLATIFRVYPSEEAAIVSFLREPATLNKEEVSSGPKVLFLDQSPDLCAFARGVLRNHGYEALSTCLVRDAKLLLTAGKVDYIVLGPDSSELPSDNVAASLKPLAANARMVVLHSHFKYEDAERATRELLEKMEQSAGSTGAS